MLSPIEKIEESKSVGKNDIKLRNINIVHKMEQKQLLDDVKEFYIANTEREAYILDQLMQEQQKDNKLNLSLDSASLIKKKSNN